MWIVKINKSKRKVLLNASVKVLFTLLLHLRGFTLIHLRGNSQVQLRGFTLIHVRGNSIGTDGPDRTRPDQTDTLCTYRKYLLNVRY